MNMNEKNKIENCRIEPKLKLINMDSIEVEQVEWLLYPFIPYGKVTIIQGDPGEGKTTMVLQIIAKLTRGEPILPVTDTTKTKEKRSDEVDSENEDLDAEDNMQEQSSVSPVNVIYQTAEDGLGDTKTAICYGMGNGLDDVKSVSNVEKHIVVAPAALEAAKYLERTYGTPYEIGYPLVDELVSDLDYNGKKVLVVQQQVMGTAIREEILKQAPDAQVTVASWFMMKPELRQEGDLHLRDEDDYVELVEKGGFDVIYADHCMERMTPKFAGIFVDTVHFAVSGRLA